MHKLYKFKFSVVECSTQQVDHYVILGDDSFLNAVARIRHLVQDNKYEVHFCGATLNE